MRYVEGVVGEVNGGLAVVEVAVRENGCGRCHEVGGCGGQNLSRALCDRKKTITVVNTLGVAVGERVQIGMDDVAIGAMATRVYVVPLIGILLGGALGQALFSDGSVGGVVGALGGFLAALAYSAIRRPAGVPSPKMSRLGAPDVVERS